jgi:hypothetical protein
MAEEGFIGNQNLWKKKNRTEKTIVYRSTLKKGPNTPSVFFFFLNGGR